MLSQEAAAVDSSLVGTAAVSWHWKDSQTLTGIGHVIWQSLDGENACPGIQDNPAQPPADDGAELAEATVP